MRKESAAVVGAMMLAVLVSCSPPSGSTGLPVGTAPAGQGGIAEVSELFKPGEEGGTKGIRFYTTDRKYRSASGYTLWSYSAGPGGSDDRTVRVEKRLGNASAGYGLVLCSGVQDVGGRDELVFMTVMINNRGEYAVGKVIGNEYRSLLPSLWERSERLRGHAGNGNELRVVKAGMNHYELYVNGGHETGFEDNEAPYCDAGGRDGYVVVIAPDDLRGSAVEVLFWEGG